MKKFWFIMALSASVGLVACGDDADSSTDPTPDAGTTEDVVDSDTPMEEDGMVGEDTTTGEDATEEDTTVEPPAEVCDDGEDNDEDGATDCEDTDCAAAANCVEAGNCADEIDNDGNGDTDCDDAACADDEACAECGEGTIFVNGNCVDTGLTPETYVPSDFVSYVNTLAIPQSGTDAECCFDFNGDGEVDNALSSLVDLLGGLAGDIDVETLINDALSEDDIAILMEWTRWAADPSEADFSLWLASNDVDGDGAPDQDFADRVAGDGIFVLETESFDADNGTGSFIQFNRTSYEGTALDAGPSRFELSIPIPGIFEEPLELTIENARITGDMEETDGAIASIPETLDTDGEDVTYGGAELGGVVLLDQVFGILDDLARDCSCVDGIDGSSAVLEFGDNGETYTAACVQTPGDASACTEDDGILCEQLSLVCTFAGSIPSLVADVDVDNNGVDDALSVGLRLGWVGASLADPAFELE